MTPETIRAPLPPHACPLESLELVEASLEPENVRAYAFRCRLCGQSVTARSEPVRYPVAPEN